ncbi:nuclear transport factor 2 family protein [Acuticoccus kandeliae]|uniref:nuclear transport factor 2 family protein n=1 Tax=Acuticoccus kandeliae TaxID=2073160 RepID=UPI000D3E7136|nr:nuclear transport factor 2 family protein [Acuticoccus kandeliae]
MNLPAPIRAYFDADGKPDGTPPISAFAQDAVVEDENHTYRGREAIDAWWRKAKAENQHVAEPITIDDKGEVTEVRAKVSGIFPGSPAELTFAFRLSDREDAIVGLRITA